MVFCPIEGGVLIEMGVLVPSDWAALIERGAQSRIRTRAFMDEQVQKGRLGRGERPHC